MSSVVSRRTKVILFGAVAISLYLLARSTSDHSATAPSLVDSSDSVSSSSRGGAPPAHHISQPPSGHIESGLSPQEPPLEYLGAFVYSQNHASSVQGYHVFDYIYLDAGKLVYAVEPDQAGKLDKVDVVTHGDGSIEWVETEAGESWFKQARGGRDGKVRIIKGATLLFHDQPGEDGYLPFHDHFLAEAYLPALKALSLVSPQLDDVPKRVLFPRCTDAGNLQGWKDAKGLNEWIIRTTLPEARIEHLSDWQRRAKTSELTVFERIVIVDRWAAHRHPDTKTWLKMNSYIAMLPSPNPDWFEPYRRAALKTLGPGTMPTSDKPVVVYLDRNRNGEVPRLTTASHEALIKLLRARLAYRAEIHVSVIRSMRKEEVVRLLARASVVVSMHGGDITSAQMWMPTKGAQGDGEGTVMELFDAESFDRENELVSRLFHHRHLVLRGPEAQLYPESEWLSKGEHVQSKDWEAQLDLQPEPVVARLEKIIDAVESERARESGNGEATAKEGSKSERIEAEARRRTSPRRQPRS